VSCCRRRVQRILKGWQVESKFLTYTSVLLLWSVAGFCSSSDAGPHPPTVGETLAEGGRKLSYAELQSLVPGSTVEQEVPGYRIRIVHSRDGTVTSSSWDDVGRTSEAHGTWEINDEGQYCMRFPGTVRVGPECKPVYSHRERYFLAKSDEPSVEVVWYQFSQ
jgi:hypothetical protein